MNSIESQIANAYTEAAETCNARAHLAGSKGRIGMMVALTVAGNLYNQAAGWATIDAERSSALAVEAAEILATAEALERARRAA